MKLILVIGIAVTISQHCYAEVGKIELFKETNFVGEHTSLLMKPGCNGVLAAGWNDKTQSIQSNGHCIILWEHYYCKGKSSKVTPQNQDALADLSVVGMNGILSSVELCESGTCTMEGFFIDPGNCNKFFRCVDIMQNGSLVRYDFTCPEGQIFDEVHAACNLPDRIDPPVPCL